MTVPNHMWVLPRPRADAYVGSFPLWFEQKLWRLVGSPECVLHPFGGLAEIGDSIDLNATTTPTWVGDAHDLHWIADGSYDLVVLDPPYSDEEAEWLYGTPRLHPARFTAEAVRVCKVGGHVAVYHRHQPRRPEGTKLVHRICVLTRTGHSPRLCFVFEKLPLDFVHQAKEQKLSATKTRPRASAKKTTARSAKMAKPIKDQMIGVMRRTGKPMATSEIAKKLPSVAPTTIGALLSFHSKKGGEFVRVDRGVYRLAARNGNTKKAAK